MFLQLHISEKTGRGVPTIVSKYSKSLYLHVADNLWLFIGCFLKNVTKFDSFARANGHL